MPPPQPYTSYAGLQGPANFGLEPERIKAYNEQARARIAAEEAAEQKREEARLQLGECFFFVFFLLFLIWGYLVSMANDRQVGVEVEVEANVDFDFRE